MAPVRLSVHRNNAPEKARKALRHEMKVAAADLASDPTIDGYAFVAWGKNQEARAFWKGGDVPSLVVGDYAKRVIELTQSIQQARSNILGDDE